jgi:hypothetical protein
MQDYCSSRRQGPTATERLHCRSSPCVGFADKLESHTIETISLLCAGAHATPEELCALRCGLLEAAAALVHAAAVPLPPRPLEADGSTTAEVAAEADAAHHLAAAVQVMMPSALDRASGANNILCETCGCVHVSAPSTFTQTCYVQPGVTVPEARDRRWRHSLMTARGGCVHIYADSE